MLVISRSAEMSSILTSPLNRTPILQSGLEDPTILVSRDHLLQSLFSFLTLHRSTPPAFLLDALVVFVDKMLTFLPTVVLSLLTIVNSHLLASPLLAVNLIALVGAVPQKLVHRQDPSNQPPCGQIFNPSGVIDTSCMITSMLFTNDR